MERDDAARHALGCGGSTGAVVDCRGLLEVLFVSGGRPELRAKCDQFKIGGAALVVYASLAMMRNSTFTSMAEQPGIKSREMAAPATHAVVL